MPTTNTPPTRADVSLALTTCDSSVDCDRVHRAVSTEQRRVLDRMIENGWIERVRCCTPDWSDYEAFAPTADFLRAAELAGLANLRSLMTRHQQSIGRRPNQRLRQKLQALQIEAQGNG